MPEFQPTLFWQNRFFNAIKTSNQKEIGDKLQISQSSVSAGLKRLQPPSNWLIALLRDDYINPLWITEGNPHPKYLVPSQSVELSMSDVLSRIQAEHPGLQVSLSFHPMPAAELAAIA